MDAWATAPQSTPRRAWSGQRPGWGRVLAIEASRVSDGRSTPKTGDVGLRPSHSLTRNNGQRCVVRGDPGNSVADVVHIQEQSHSFHETRLWLAGLPRRRPGGPSSRPCNEYPMAERPKLPVHVHELVSRSDSVIAKIRRNARSRAERDRPSVDHLWVELLQGSWPPILKQDHDSLGRSHLCFSSRRSRHSIRWPKSISTLSARLIRILGADSSSPPSRVGRNTLPSWPYRRNFARSHVHRRGFVRRNESCAAFSPELT